VRKASPALIGAFVLGAIALGVAGVMVLGSGRFFTKTTTFVMYFPGSVDGLSIGAPVKFKGVEIGTVTDIRINLGAYRTEDARIPVVVAIDDARAEHEGAETSVEAVDALVRDRGLRAQLQPQSLLTGLLFVQLNFFPGTAAVTVLPPGSPYREIPTIPTTIEQAQQTIGRILTKLETADIEGVLTSARQALDGVHDVTRAPDLQRAVALLPHAVGHLDEAARSITALSGTLDRDAPPVLADARLALAHVDGTLAQWTGVGRQLKASLDPDAPLVSQLSAALDELSGAARSVRLAADLLERDPSALLRGRGRNAP
jgi:paraquat-inducible protein B